MIKRNADFVTIQHQAHGQQVQWEVPGLSRWNQEWNWFWWASLFTWCLFSISSSCGGPPKQPRGQQLHSWLVLRVHPILWRAASRFTNHLKPFHQLNIIYARTVVARIWQHRGFWPFRMPQGDRICYVWTILKIKSLSWDMFDPRKGQLVLTFSGRHPVLPVQWLLQQGEEEGVWQ